MWSIQSGIFKNVLIKLLSPNFCIFIIYSVTGNATSRTKCVSNDSLFTYFFVPPLICAFLSRFFTTVLIEHLMPNFLQINQVVYLTVYDLISAFLCGFFENVLIELSLPNFLHIHHLISDRLAPNRKRWISNDGLLICLFQHWLRVSKWSF